MQVVTFINTKHEGLDSLYLPNNYIYVNLQINVYYQYRPLSMAVCEFVRDLNSYWIFVYW